MTGETVRHLDPQRVGANRWHTHHPSAFTTVAFWSGRARSCAPAATSCLCAYERKASAMRWLGACCDIRLSAARFAASGQCGPLLDRPQMGGRPAGRGPWRNAAM